ncbi:DUF3137 domain-containing protein [Maricaulis sp.]|uniref:DUF3137 domain-containing protein n=1 Tax=Maricaulis sp. TaxID=1486257 RepID=UPI0026203C8E|nr:DUF3137 domain-containing protein [Maricaulis sp.]
MAEDAGKADWNTLWNDRLKPWLEGLESERRAAVRERRLWTLGGAVLGLGAGAAVAANTGEAVIAAFGLAGGLVAGLLIGNRRVHRLAKRVKSRLNTAVAEALGLSYAGTPAEPARFSTFRDYGLLPSSDRRAFEDHFSGHREGCDFELYEAHLEQKRRSDKRTYYVTVFRGVLIRINFPRRVEGVTVITRDRGWFNGLAALGRSFGSNKLERIGLVDPKFERVFEVYGNDQVLARYMLTPSFMERLLALEESLHGKHVRALFDADSGQGELLIAAETGDFFEIGTMSRPLADQSRVQALVGELTQVLGLIELLVEPAKFGEHAAVDMSAMTDNQA